MHDRCCRGEWHISLALAVLAVVLAADPSVAQPANGRSRPELSTANPLGPDDNWDTVAVDIAVRRWLLESGGSFGQDTPPTKFRLERSKARGQWRTVITVTSLSPITIKTPAGDRQLERPDAIARIEDDEDGSPVRLYDVRGELVVVPPMPASPPDRWGFALPTLPTPSGHGMSVRAIPDLGTEWIDDLVTSVAARPRRKDRLERRFGSPVGKLRGLNRHLRKVGEDLEEVLVDPQTGAQVEANRVRNGQLEAHVTWAYELLPGGALAQRVSRSEHLLRRDGNERAVVEMQFSNVIFERRK